MPASQLPYRTPPQPKHVGSQASECALAQQLEFGYEPIMYGVPELFVRAPLHLHKYKIVVPRT